MSSKNRKTEQVPLGFVEPNKNEYYFTPPEVIRAILPKLRFGGIESNGAHHPRPRSFLDAGSGKGEIATVLQSQFPRAQAWGVEIDAKRREASKWFVKWDELADDDFMKAERYSYEGVSDERRPELIVTNPPFSLWHKWITRCCDLVHPKGEVVAFGRVETLEGVRGSFRAALWDGRSWDLYPLAWRPTCTGAGRDSASYLVAIFGSSRDGRTERLYRLPQDEP